MKTAAVQEITQRQRLEVAEQFGVADQKYRETAKPIVDERDRLRKIIQGWYEEAPADKASTIETPHFTVIVGERANKRSITNMRGLAKYLASAFYKLCSVPLTEFDRYVPPPDRKKFVTEEQAGAREVKAIRKVEPIADMEKAA